MKAAELLELWKANAAMLDDVACAAQAATFRRCVRELEAALAQDAEEELTLAQAKAESGYDKDSLTRLMREGKVPNVGRKHAPRIRRGDLPRKPKASDLTPATLMRIIPRKRRSS